MIMLDMSNLVGDNFCHAQVVPVILTLRHARFFHILTSVVLFSVSIVYFHFD